jgi:hypothetical protein
MREIRRFSSGDRGDKQSSKGSRARKQPFNPFKQLAKMESQNRPLGDLGNPLNGESESSMQLFESKNLQNPDNAQTANSTKKVYKRQYSTGKKSRKKQKNQKKTIKKGKLKETVKSELEEVIESTRFDGKKEKIHQMYEILEKSSKGRFKRVKHLIDGEYKIEVIDDSTQKMVKSAKDIWQSALHGKEEQPIQGLVSKLGSPDLYRLNWGY